MDSIGGSTFYAYRMDFSCSIVDEQFSGFVFLIEAKLEDDVGSVQMDLFMHSNKQVKAIITPCGQVRFDSEQVFHHIPSLLLTVCIRCIVFDVMFHSCLTGQKSKTFSGVLF